MSNETMKVIVQKKQIKKRKPFEIQYKNVQVTARIQKEDKIILHSTSGIFRPGSFTAIIGPSGSGKTTFLNLLSGKLFSTNLIPSGQIKVNGKYCKNINKFCKYLGYVMQQDVLLPTFTPRQAFTFVVKLKMNWLNQIQIKEKVEQVIQKLGIKQCANTYIGNNLIRGISGGQRKRTSIGIQLLTDPSILFLDQPTTGLDSTTALNIMQFIKQMSREGRTIISTIHQPSSQLFDQFDRIMLMVQGYVIYKGTKNQSLKYFEKIGFKVPLYTNPSDYYMKLMNKDGIYSIQQDQEKRIRQFQKRLNCLIQNYNKQYKEQKSECNQQLTIQDHKPNSFYVQFKQIFKRSVINQIRNPLDLMLRFFQIIIQSLFCIILFYQIRDVEQYPQAAQSNIQNIQGTIFFFVSTSSFQGTITNISTFSSQRKIFIKERVSDLYSSLSYFLGKNFAYLPVDILIVLIFISMTYFACNLNETAGKFFIAFLILIATMFVATSYGIFLSNMFQNLQLAVSLIPVFLVPLMMVAGFFNSKIPIFLIWLQYLSFFKYSYQALIINQFTDPQKIQCFKDNNYRAQCDYLEQRFEKDLDLYVNVGILFGYGLLLRVISFILLYYLSNPKTVKLKINNDIEQNKEVIQK